MISYAQNGEDVVLDRFFRAKTGLYIDVGASYPIYHSVTRHFYQLGWRGINVEPDPACFAMVCEDRPADVNLCMALAAAPGEAPLHVIPHTGLSTLRTDIAAQWSERGYAPQPTSATIGTLAGICRQHAPAGIDFLKVDVEGLEGEVIAGGDWQAFRPRVVVVEAVHPLDGTPGWADWEDLLEGYEFTLFDGLNRFYCRTDEPGIDRLRVGANVTDHFTPYDLYVTERKLAAEQMGLPATDPAHAEYDAWNRWRVAQGPDAGEPDAAAPDLRHMAAR